MVKMISILMDEEEIQKLDDCAKEILSDRSKIIRAATRDFVELKLRQVRKK